MTIDQALGEDALAHLSLDGQLPPDVQAIGRKAVRGLGWSLAGTAASKVAGLVLGLVMARLLAPTEFGLFAVAFAATQFVMMIKDLGVIAAMSHWRGPLDEMTPTASSIALAFSTVLYGVMWVGAPAFAELAGNSEAASVVRLLTAVILIEGVTAVRSGALLRDFRQRRIVVANLCGLSVNATVAICMAVSGAGAMSMAAGQVAGAAVIGVIVFASAGIPFRFGFDRAIAGQLLRYGLPLAGGLAIEAILLNADFIIIGSRLGTTHLGYYLLAFNISSWALTSITMSIRYVSVPSFARLSEMNTATLSDSAQRSISTLYRIIIPVGALTAVLSTPIVLFLYGNAWAPAASALRFLAILTIVRVLISFALDILMGAGSTRAMLWINTAWATVLIPALFVGIDHWGIRGAGIAHAAVGVFVATPLAIIALRRLGIHLSPIIPTLVRPTVAGAFSGTLALLICRLIDAPAVVELLLAGGTGLTTYIGLVATHQELRGWADRLRRRFRLARPTSSAVSDQVSLQQHAALER